MKRLSAPASRHHLHAATPLRAAIAKTPTGLFQFSQDDDLRAVFDSSGEALLMVDFEGFIQRANLQAARLLRRKAITLSKMDLSTFLLQPLPEEFSRLCAMQASSNAFASFEGLLISGSPVRITFRVVLGGSQNLLLCLQEGSHLERGPKNWRQVEAELTSLLDSVAAGTILVDANGHIRFFNARFGQYFGLDRSQLQATKTFENLDLLVASRFHVPENFAAPWRKYVQGCGKAGHDELEMHRPSHRVLERFARPVLDSEGQSVGWLELYYDVTGDRQIQSKLLQTEKMAAVGELVSGIAHELNNPLTTIMGYGQLLLGQDLTAAQLSDATKVFQEAERARRIVKNLLYFARENKPERTRVDLNQIVERAVALRSYEMKVENISIECALAPDLPETLADPYQLQQVVLNLLVNAEQALLQDRGQGHIKIGTWLAEGNRIALVVSDDGAGIPREIVSRIFDPFFTTKPPGVGTGLGLSIVYGIVKQHDGEVTFENQVGGGACFLVEMPVIDVPADGQPLNTLEDAYVRMPVTAGRIMVVEDEPTVAQLIVDVLREEGHQVEAVLESQEALTRLSRGRYDLVVCDLRMPCLDGPAFYEALVRAGSPAQNRIMFVTGDTLAPRTMQFLAKNSLPYLEKPFLVEELKLAVNRRLECIRYNEQNQSESRSHIEHIANRQP